MVGLEIKRGILVGELVSPRRAALPIAAAFGGAVMPAVIYTAINAGTEGASGWGIPMAVDIAFALGVLALLGERAPISLKVFLTALAIVEHALHPWGVFLIMPLFALVNAGVPLGGGLAEALSSRIALGIVAGFVLGKQLGMTLLARMTVKLGVSELPEGITWRQVYGAGWLAGIGFTMSLFISDLALASDPLLYTAKPGVLGASLIAGTMEWAILGVASAPPADA